MSRPPLVSHTAVAGLAAAGVVAWRVLAYLRPSSMITLTPGFEVAMAGVGLFFVAVGWTVYRLRPDPSGRLFFVWCLCAGVHWGGAIGAGSRGVELFLLFVYLGVSVAGEASLLHLALRFPSAWSLPGAIVMLLYAPAVAGVVMAPLAGFLSNETLGAAVGILLLAGHALGLGAGLVFIVRLLRSDRLTRQRARLGIVVAAFVAAGVPSLLASLGILPGPSEGYNLLSVLAPAALGYALVRQARAPEESAEI